MGFVVKGCVVNLGKMSLTQDIAMSDYLSGYWEPDCEYADGSIVDRFIGDHDS